MPDLRSDSVKASEPASSRPVPVPDFAPIVEERRSPVILVLSLLSAMAAAVLFLLAKAAS